MGLRGMGTAHLEAVFDGLQTRGMARQTSGDALVQVDAGHRGLLTRSGGLHCCGGMIHCVMHRLPHLESGLERCAR